ncbi:1-acyl-sn-glycerol-3-phosphate acyltransferase [Arcanobacterium pinnipediorum]|uniref:1-acyl-sn-glycerol-3-phosphate acyltransferase n=1 Tax=Arcanobacterium pinnipediorum TaxID=1503041 RepID=A0ABY5AJH2_9ACTO|nr:1-acyl-sn-glycerol-3-phosphate acyltransferase [Arcanobacterium pinnipediorum]USR79394.1 1-acyl-sn-glycerol-3-phosphate acyltransferase [Arcanobacterium pinnipediorum]
MSIKRFISHTFQKFSRWELQVEPLPPKAIVIGAPHTSNWDAIYMLVAFWHSERNLRFLVKDSVIRSPLGPIARAFGAVGVDRHSPHGVVSDIAQQARHATDFTLCLAPKGTRSKRDTWRSGFYHIAYEAGVPVVFGFIDSHTRTYGWRGSMMLSGDRKADMDRIREFYEPLAGIHPELTSTPRLRDESPLEN